MREETAMRPDEPEKAVRPKPENLKRGEQLAFNPRVDDRDRIEERTRPFR